jgi:hypothetical protein
VFIPIFGMFSRVSLEYMQVTCFVENGAFWQYKDNTAFVSGASKGYGSVCSGVSMRSARIYEAYNLLVWSTSLLVRNVSVSKISKLEIQSGGTWRTSKLSGRM